MKNIIIILLVFGVLGCASIPTPERGMGVVAFHMNAENESGNPWLVSYKIRFGERLVTLRPKNGVFFVQVPAGVYRKMEINSVSRVANVRQGGGTDLWANFEVKEGLVTPFPFEFYFTQVAIDKNRSSQRYKFFQLDFASYNNIKAALEVEDADGVWTLAPYDNEPRPF